MGRGKQPTYSLRDVVDDDGAVCIAVVHGGQRFVAFLAGCVPDLELDRRVLVEGDGLGKEGGAYGGFPVVVKLVLDEAQHERRLGWLAVVLAGCIAGTAGKSIPFPRPIHLCTHVSHSSTWPKERSRPTEQDELELREPGAARPLALLLCPGRHLRGVTVLLGLLGLLLSGWSGGMYWAAVIGWRAEAGSGGWCCDG